MDIDVGKRPHIVHLQVMGFLNPSATSERDPNYGYAEVVNYYITVEELSTFMYEDTNPPRYDDKLVEMGHSQRPIQL